MNRFLLLLGDLDRTMATLRGELDRMDAVIDHTGQAVAAGVTFRDLYGASEAPRARDSLIEALNAVHSALMISRAEAIRVMVDEEGMTVSEVARLVGHPRQLVKRAYDAAAEPAGSEGGRP